MDPAQTLTAAAQKLRRVATEATAGPWIVHQANGFLRVDNGREAWKSGADLAEENRDTAEYIALVHPGVGLALADWLDTTAATWGFVTHSNRDASLAVARKILGEVTE